MKNQFLEPLSTTTYVSDKKCYAVFIPKNILSCLILCRLTVEFSITVSFSIIHINYSMNLKKWFLFIIM
jgi:hypothetical protein